MCLTGRKSWINEAPVISIVFFVETGSPIASFVTGIESILISLWSRPFAVLVYDCSAYEEYWYQNIAVLSRRAYHVECLAFLV
jgi:hypothetical protein